MSLVGLFKFISNKWRIHIIILHSCLFLLSSFCLSAQEITGVWKGSIFDDSTKTNSPVEIVITGNPDFFRGYVYLTYTDKGKPISYLKKIKVNYRKGNIAFEEFALLSGDSIILNNQNANLTYAAAFSSAEQINGIWKSVKKKAGAFTTGAIKLLKEYDFEEAAIYKKLQELDLTKDLSFNKKEPEPETLAKLPAVQFKKLTINSALIKAKAKEIAVARKSPAVIVKPPVITEEPKVEIAVVEKKITPPVVVKPVVEKKPEPVVKKEVPTVAVKPSVEKKLPPPPPKKEVVAAPKPQPVAAKVPLPKKETVVQAPPPPPVVKKETPVVAAVLPSAKTGAVEVSSRKTSTIQTVEYQSDSLTLTLYDNGEVDGDTVSVLMNGKVIFSKVGLTTKPNRKTIYIDKDTPDSLTMVMYAENLGSIPPNTGLLVVWDGELVYEVRFSADLKSNAAIIFRRKPKE
ncbi:hypothetical protein LK994_01995 [Ferruginibacter lapsinanis]|uniref:hypothetical protein n=1 Tax=Ferruginibacter lapsinanis TaxID=563172 RepID=UPI001E42F62A|nr:hypothetical protein [Ferruginibacter lapsinanis]UEG50246.1 hypothetical protein LK994_01995 [Ferruginibacter lapsinanis]